MPKITLKQVYDVVTEITIGIAIFSIIFMGFSVLTTPQKSKSTIIYKDRLIICYPKDDKQSSSKTKPKLECIEHITKSK